MGKYISFDIRAGKKKLNKAFAELRKLGYTAKQNFMCCQGCAWSELSEDQREKAVFYHRQDADQLLDDGNCCLAWAGNGAEIVEVLEKHDIKVSWNGSERQRIEITII